MMHSAIDLLKTNISTKNQSTKSCLRVLSFAFNTEQHSFFLHNMPKSDETRDGPTFNSFVKLEQK